jgi:hypothetical protein
MRLYYTGASPNNLRQARLHAPSHVHGAGWTPAKMTPHDVPYFVDNGAFTDRFDMDAWLDSLEQAKTGMPRWPDFIVWPDVYGDAEATRERCRQLFHRDASLLPRREDFQRYVVFQPGLSLDELFDWAAKMGADGIFLGGPQRWQRAHGAEIVERAHAHDWRVHLGNPGGKDGLLWAYRVGFDSVDTTTIFQNGYWHYLDALEDATEETGMPTPTRMEASAQAHLGDWAG